MAQQEEAQSNLESRADLEEWQPEAMQSNYYNISKPGDYNAFPVSALYR